MDRDGHFGGPDATSSINLVAALQGTGYGRYFGGRNYGGFTGIATGQTGTVATSLQRLTGTTGRAAIAAATANLASVGENLGGAGDDPTVFAGAAQTTAAAVLSACADPADGVRLLGGLADFTPAAPAASDPIGAASYDIQDAAGDLFRRAAVVALARAAMTYQPASYDDAANLRTEVTDQLDQEITIAGDQEEDGAYEALRALRIAVVRDLTQRGATLAPMAPFSTGAPMPALTLAVRLYRDAGRSDQLVTQVDPIHPAFMPPAFRALAR